MHSLTGNWGVSIILLTILIKLIFFPLSAASYKSMAKMKLVTPRLTKIREMYGNDRNKMNQAMMELYKTEKINPLGGCFPILVQIPVFIALYWVLLAAIELRHAPFVGWIKDLSAPDPTSMLNLFGLIPYNPHAVLPSFLAFFSVGVWPIIYGITQWVQTKMNPPPPDPVQAKMFSFMPIIFTFMFLWAPAGVAVYWLMSNLWGIGQQYATNYMIGPPVIKGGGGSAAERRVKRVGAGKTDAASLDSSS